MFTNRKQLHENHLVQSQSVFATVLHHQHLLVLSSRSTQPGHSQLYSRSTTSGFHLCRLPHFHPLHQLPLHSHLMHLPSSSSTQPTQSQLFSRSTTSRFHLCRLPHFHPLQQLPLHSHLIHLPLSSSTQPTKS